MRSPTCSPARARSATRRSRAAVRTESDRRHATRSRRDSRQPSLVLFDRGDEVVVQAGDEGIRFLLVSGKPLEEPVAWYGPIVMNTEDELQPGDRRAARRHVHQARLAASGDIGLEPKPREARRKAPQKSRFSVMRVAVLANAAASSPIRRFAFGEVVVAEIDVEQVDVPRQLDVAPAT